MHIRQAAKAHKPQVVGNVCKTPDPVTCEFRTLFGNTPGGWAGWKPILEILDKQPFWASRDGSTLVMVPVTSAEAFRGHA